jgi:hypothetical protein
VLLREICAGRHALIIMIQVAGDLRVRRVAGEGRRRPDGAQGRQRRLAVMRSRRGGRRELAGGEPAAARGIGGHQRRARGILLWEEVELRLVGREGEEVLRRRERVDDVLVVILRGRRRGEDLLLALVVLFRGRPLLLRVCAVRMVLMRDEGCGKQRRHSRAVCRCR